MVSVSQPFVPILMWCFHIDHAYERSHSLSSWSSLRELLCVTPYIRCRHGRRSVQESPMSTVWSLFFSLVETLLNCEKSRLLYMLSSSSANEPIVLVLLVFKVVR